MNDVEQYLAAQSIYSKLGEIVSTKTPNNLRDQVAQGYRAEYERTGGKSFVMRVNGEPVATWSISETRPTKEQTETVFDLNDEIAFDDWFQSEDGQTAIAWYADAHMMDFIRWYVARTGEVPAGVGAREVVSKQAVTRREYKGCSVRGLDGKKFDPDKVLAAFGLELPTAIAGLLGE